MSLRKDLPNLNHLSNLPMHPGLIRASAGQQEGPRAVLAAVETVGAQIREHRASLDTRLNGLQADLQATQQAMAKIEANGSGGSFPMHKRVSAEVLASAESGLEELRSGVRKSLRISLSSLHAMPSAATITSTGAYPVSERDAEIYGSLARQFSVRDLLVVRNTNATAIEYLRGTRTGIAAIQAAEGDQKAELALAFSLQSSPVRTIACWVPASRQVLDDFAMLGDYIDGELRDALRQTEDAQLLKGNGVGSNLQGLMTLASAYNRGETGDTPNDTIRRAITQVQLARGQATGIVVNPAALERMELQKDTQGRYVSTFNVTDSNGRTVTWRVPVVVTDAVGELEFLVGDFVRAARLYDRQQATVEIATEHADFFTRNLVALLCEERVALTVNRPDLLVIGAFDAEGA